MKLILPPGAGSRIDHACHRPCMTFIDHACSMASSDRSQIAARRPRPSPESWFLQQTLARGRAKSDPTRPPLSISTSTPQRTPCPDARVGGVNWSRTRLVSYWITVTANLHLYPISVYYNSRIIILFCTQSKYILVQIYTESNFCCPGSDYRTIYIFV